MRRTPRLLVAAAAIAAAMLAFPDAGHAATPFTVAGTGTVSRSGGCGPETLVLGGLSDGAGTWELQAVWGIASGVGCSEATGAAASGPMTAGCVGGLTSICFPNGVPSSGQTKAIQVCNLTTCYEGSVSRF